MRRDPSISRSYLRRSVMFLLVETLCLQDMTSSSWLGFVVARSEFRCFSLFCVEHWMVIYSTEWRWSFHRFHDVLEFSCFYFRFSDPESHWKGRRSLTALEFHLESPWQLLIWVLLKRQWSRMWHILLVSPVNLGLWLLCFKLITSCLIVLCKPKKF